MLQRLVTKLVVTKKDGLYDLKKEEAEIFVSSFFDTVSFDQICRGNTMEDSTERMTLDNLCNRVHTIRGQQVMLDYDLAEIYVYEVKRLNE